MYYVLKNRLKCILLLICFKYFETDIKELISLQDFYHELGIFVLFVVHLHDHSHKITYSTVFLSRNFSNLTWYRILLNPSSAKCSVLITVFCFRTFWHSYSQLLYKLWPQLLRSFNSILFFKIIYKFYFIGCLYLYLKNVV